MKNTTGTKPDFFTILYGMLREMEIPLET